MVVRQFTSVAVRMYVRDDVAVNGVVNIRAHRVEGERNVSGSLRAEPI